MQNFDEIQLDNQHPKNNYEIPETRTSEEKIKKLEDFEMHRRLMEEQVREIADTSDSTKLQINFN